MQNKVLIKEIFESIQGEGPYIGVNQLFIRFSKCNLNCAYCDTDFKTDLKEYSLEELLTTIRLYKNIHSISLTGAEPLLEVDFLYEFLKRVNHKIYLETNGTLYKNLEKIIDYLDIISMDIKLPSSSKMQELYNEHAKFIQIAAEKNKEIFLKVVFDNNITNSEIEKTIELAKPYNLLIVLQPKSEMNKLSVDSNFINEIFQKYCKLYNNVRLIPQVHKFINVR